MTVCVSTCLCGFWLLPRLHQRLRDCSGSLDECLSCISPISLPRITKSAVLHCGLPSTHAHLCPALSPDPSPYQLRTQSCRDSHVHAPSTGPITTPVVKTSSPLSVSDSHELKQRDVQIYKHTFPLMFFSASGLSTQCLPWHIPPGLPVTLLTLLLRSLGQPLKSAPTWIHPSPAQHSGLIYGATEAWKIKRRRGGIRWPVGLN